MQAGIYTRISHDPRGESLGVTRQEEDCRRVAQAAGWTVADVYKDNDVSATSGTPRPEYERMLADIDAGRIEAVVVWHVDRLYRTMKDLQTILPVVQKYKVPIRTVQAGDLDLSTSTGQMLAEILAAVAGQEGRVKSERWRRSWRQRRELGHVTPSGWRTFGYTRDGEVVPKEAERLRTIADEVLAGKGLRTICDELNAEGVKTTRPKSRDGWQGNGLRKLLRNPRIAGYATYKGDIVGDGNWEPILERETWRTLCALLDARSTPARPAKFLLAGMLTCGACGKTLHTRKGRGYWAYNCLKSRGGCGGVDVHTERVHDFVETFVRDKLADPRLRRRIAEHRHGGNTHLLNEIEALQDRLAEIDAQMADPGRSMASLVKASDTVRARIDELQAQLSTSVPVQMPSAADWPTDLGRRRRIIRAVLRAIYVDPAPIRGGRFDPTRLRIDLLV
ncbi:MAG TPA: recombinase family protein [Actinomycetes bacterium]